MSVIVLTTEIDATGMLYRDLNAQIREAVSGGAEKLVIKNVNGQRYIGTNLYGVTDPEVLRRLVIEIHGTPGNDLGAFLDGPTITVHGNVMDGSGNTMNCGRIVAHGRAGDITGFSARGGEIFVRGNAGYRAGIHMKEYQEKRPVIVIGGTAQDFLGEYMAGGVIIVMGLTLNPGEAHYCSHVGTGMHGGAIFVRGIVSDHQLGNGVGVSEVDAEDSTLLSEYTRDYAALFGTDVDKVTADQFVKLSPLSKRPYKEMYAY